ncbi:type I restriction modification DNA specificity domain protein [Helicobacter pylori]|uniref:restriction endonuclease subunit S n=1 Tax=Helicobacter pylori TaxID=210 RepID=UPI000F715FF8|nr:restriction endonuclease subunit S [Helicobacter pylori]VEJ22442.1 type I restriction modification DNA specificity domain protein [Helicobacter pylori]VEJ23255.1 type I restriction modification DNA specificity domain protein [Helicobacter pylori]
MDALTTPSNWQRVRLGDIAEIKRGVRITKNELDVFGKYPVVSGGVGFLGYTNNFNRYENTITIAQYGTAGYVNFQKNKFWANDICFCVYPNKDVIKNIFLYYFLKVNQNYLYEISNRNATPYSISKDKILDFEILLPPLNEQIAIANILSDVDRYLYSLDALILKKESVKKALSFELLSQRKRLKGFNQAWQRVRLGDIGITISGLAGKTKQDFINGNAKYITFLNVLNNVIIDTSILENVKIYPNEKQNSFKKYDLFFNTSSETPKEVGMCAVLLDDIDQVFLNSFCFGFRIFDKAVDSLFLSYLINSEIGRKAFENLAQGSTRYNLSKSGFNNVCLILPPLNEQIAIANILSGLDHEIISLKNKKRQFENIKKALNHDLMSAKIRVLKK